MTKADFGWAVLCAFWALMCLLGGLIARPYVAPAAPSAAEISQEQEAQRQAQRQAQRLFFLEWHAQQLDAQVQARPDVQRERSLRQDLDMCWAAEEESSDLLESCEQRLFVAEANLSACIETAEATPSP